MCIFTKRTGGCSMCQITLDFEKTFSFSSIFERTERKRQVHSFLVSLNQARMKKQVTGKLYEDETGIKIKFDELGFGVFNSPMSNAITQLFTQSKEMDFHTSTGLTCGLEFAINLCCEIDFLKVNSHHARVYELVLSSPLLQREGIGRLYTRADKMAIVYDKPSFTILNPFISDAIFRELADTEWEQEFLRKANARF